MRSSASSIKTIEIRRKRPKRMKVSDMNPAPTALHLDPRKNDKTLPRKIGYEAHAKRNQKAKG